MTINMNDLGLNSVDQVKIFLLSTETMTFEGASQAERYTWITTTLCRFKYFTLKKAERGLVKQYLKRMTGYDRSHITRLIQQQLKIGQLLVYQGKRGRSFTCKYLPEDIALLADTDLAHSRLAGPATVAIFKREYTVFKNTAYIRLKDLSVGHLYNLRGTRQYTSRTKFFSKTKATSVAIGERRKPQPQGQPGYIRVDTVHQGDDMVSKEKGVYHINMVDDVLQWEVAGAVKTICDRDLVPLLESLLAQYPFRIQGFHSDNGSEYINRQVAQMLNRLLIKQTKSRPRHCNDNALGESKNGAVIRKHMGYIHIPRSNATAITTFYTTYFNPYLNYHRPSGYATVTTDKKGKQKKVYDVYQTPYERFLSLPSPEQYLKPGITLEQLKIRSTLLSDNQAAEQMQQAKHILFSSFRKS